MTQFKVSRYQNFAQERVMLSYVPPTSFFQIFQKFHSIIWNFVLRCNLWLYDLCRRWYLWIISELLLCGTIFCVLYCEVEMFPTKSRVHSAQFQKKEATQDFGEVSLFKVYGDFYKTETSSHIFPPSNKQRFGIRDDLIKSAEFFFLAP